MRSLYKIKNISGSTLDFGTVAVADQDELVIYNRAKDATPEGIQTLREAIDNSEIELYRFDNTLVINPIEAHDAITAYENAFGKLTSAALSVQEIKIAFYRRALQGLIEEVLYDTTTEAEQVAIEDFVVACNTGLVFLARAKLNALSPVGNLTVARIDKYKACVDAVIV